jgi:hypothetical protein
MRVKLSHRCCREQFSWPCHSLEPSIPTKDLLICDMFGLSTTYTNSYSMLNYYRSSLNVLCRLPLISILPCLTHILREPSISCNNMHTDQTADGALRKIS